jgi:hypothetical protein
VIVHSEHGPHGDRITDAERKRIVVKIEKPPMKERPPAPCVGTV